jgi:hypothetical protein
LKSNIDSNQRKRFCPAFVLVVGSWVQKPLDITEFLLGDQQYRKDSAMMLACSTKHKKEADNKRNQDERETQKRQKHPKIAKQRKRGKKPHKSNNHSKIPKHKHQ